MKPWLCFILLICIIICHPVFSDQSNENIPENINRANIFVDNVSKGNYTDSAKYFDKTMRIALPINKLEETWKSILMQVGSFEEKKGVRMEMSGEFSVVYITCKFERFVLDTKIVFNKDNTIAGLFFIPHTKTSMYKFPVYIKADAFTEIEVTVGLSDWKLPGTLAIPKGNGPFPAVILIHGSGPQDRDESIGPNKPFKDLAAGLASKVIAVLRYEKRTKQYSEKMAKDYKNVTLKEEVTDDVLSAFELLRKTEKIDKKRIFLVGHSLGGMLIPRLGMSDKDIHGLIIMAGNTRSLEDLIIDQTKYLLSINNEMQQKDKDDQLTTMLKQVNKIKQRNYNLDTPLSELPLSLPPAYWQDLQKYNPVETAKGLTQPILILQGERDYQVTKEDFQGWQFCFKDKTNTEYKLYPKLNHLFMEGNGKSTPQEYFLESHIPDYVINDIVAWINKNI